MMQSAVITAPNAQRHGYAADFNPSPNGSWKLDAAMVAPENKPTPQENVAQLRHDMLNCLCVARLRLEVLKKAGTHNDNDLEILQQCVVRLRLLIEQWRKLDADYNCQAVEPAESFDLCQLVAQFVDTYKPVAQEKNVRLVFRKQPDSVKIAGVRIQYERLIDNLISNAWKYTPAGGVVAVDLRIQDTQIRFTVADTGIGIHQQEIPHIFDRYYRSRTAHAHNIPGSGLGLTTVKEIVECLGGEISVRSQVGGGSTFVVTLPISQ